MSLLSEVLGLAHFVLALCAAGHAVLYQRQARGAALWCVVVFLVPWVGPVLYLLLGINRISRAGRTRRELAELNSAWSEGNQVTPLVSGDIAYPAMLAAIGRAAHTIYLSTYIFDSDTAELRFCDALAQAVRRGVQVRVLIDAVGARYSRPSAVRALQSAGVKAALFLPTRTPWRWPYANLRNHRKLLIVDGEQGFIGGMNIRQCCLLALDPVGATLDVHFAVRGPVVVDMERLFAGDWEFSTGERLECPERAIDATGQCRARLVHGGPDRPEEPIRWLHLAAVVRAASRVRIVTPYFVADEDVITALCAASAAGVRIQIILPAVSNLRAVGWASRGCWAPLLRRGIEIRLSPPPFEHTKVMLVDDELAIIGSANWDERSFRLNFECSLECRDPALVAKLSGMVAERAQASRPVSLNELSQRPLLGRLRDRVAWLALPYL
jgi:cardiolipin synthase A/B